MLYEVITRPTPAPEYRMSWGDRATVRATMQRILAWDFERIVVAHGALIDEGAKAVARRAWRAVLD